MSDQKAYQTHTNRRNYHMHEKPTKLLLELGFKNKETQIGIGQISPKAYGC